MAPHVELKQDIRAHPRRNAAWLLIVSCALIVAVVSIGFAVINAGNRSIAEPPAVLATPSAVLGVPAPARETTTGSTPEALGQPSRRQD